MKNKKNIILIATLDTKGNEAKFIKKLIKSRGHKVIIIDTGLLGNPLFKGDISRQKIAKYGGKSLDSMRKRPKRSISNYIMGEGTAKAVYNLYKEGKLDGVIGIGGSQGTAMATRAMRELPIGVPKLMLSTMASGNVRPYVDIKDITMMNSVIDIAGINSISAPILSNAANAICGMIEQKLIWKRKSKKVIAITMYGTTTPCVMKASELLNKAGFETVIFHASGTGGKAMENLILEGRFDGVLDITIAEITNELLEGIQSAGPNRLEAAGEIGIPQLVVPGGSSICVFGPKGSVPERYVKEKRTQIVHNTQMTLIRTNRKECEVLGKIIASKLNKAKGPTKFIVPKKSYSFYSEKGQGFYNPEYNHLLASTVRNNLKKEITYEGYNFDINNPKFAEIIAIKMINLMKGTKND